MANDTPTDAAARFVAATADDPALLAEVRARLANPSPRVALDAIVDLAARRGYRFEGTALQRALAEASTGEKAGSSDAADLDDDALAAASGGEDQSGRRILSDEELEAERAEIQMKYEFRKYFPFLPSLWNL